MAQPTARIPLPAGDFNELLHELRGRELERLPAGANTVLSGGCAGTWYFEWFAERYPTAVERHIGIEAIAPMPDDLPENVEWVFSSLGDLAAVIDGEVDLAFAGEVLEHLWPDEIAGFFTEAHRVLRDDGRLVIDSPNRRATTALSWTQPEHTVEFTVDEIVELLDIAGFGDLRIRGIWLCYDRSRHRFLPLEPDPGDTSWSRDRRASEAEERPEDSFLWWVEARREPRDPDVQRLIRRVREIYDAYRTSRFASMTHDVGELHHEGDNRVVVARIGKPGFVLNGPSLPVPSGRWRADFRIQLGERAPDGPSSLAFAEVTQGNPPVIVAAKELTDAEIGHGIEWHQIAVPFTLDRPAFGVQFRVRSTGAAALRVRLGVELVEDSTLRDQLDVGERVEAQRSAVGEPQVSPRPPAHRLSFVRKAGRAVLWPVRRILDPRFQGLAAHVQTTHDDVAKRLDDAHVRQIEVLEQERRQHEATRGEVQHLNSLLREDIDASREATTVMGSSLSDLLTGVEQARQAAETASGEYFDRLAEGDVADLDPHVSNLLNYAASHRGFAAQRGLWFNPPISLRYTTREVKAVHTNERVVEVPYAIRALSDLKVGASILDVGAAESTLAYSLAVLGYDVTALDLRPYPLSHPRLRPVEGRIEDWLSERSYDAVLCISTIEHIGVAVYGEDERMDADLVAMGRMHELTKAGGLLVLTTPVGKAVSGKTERTYDRQGLERLLTGWRVDDLTVAKRRDDLTWELAEDIEEREDVDQVALITARRGE